MRKMVVFDIDDLLFETKVRKEVYDDEKIKLNTSIVKRNYENGEYFVYDSPLPFAIDITNAFKDGGYSVAYITGRRKSMLGATFEQFDLYGIPYDKKLVFHKDTKQQDTTNYKSFTFDILKRSGYDIKYFFDDTLENCEMAKTKGIPFVYENISDFLIDVYIGKIKTDLNWIF